MQGMKLFKKFLIPGGLCGAVPAIRPVPPSPDKPVECNNETNLIRPSELPIYIHETSSCTTKHNTSCCADKNSLSFLEQGFGTLRKNVQGIIKEYDYVRETVNNKVSTGLEHSQFMLDYLREEGNALPRVGAVVMGGLTGLILSLRGGKFKKMIYTTAGAATIAAICYPNKTKDSLVSSKHYINIAYNFVYGVKPGDENQLEISWPEFPKLTMPSSFSDLADLVKITGVNMAKTFGSLIGKKYEIKSVNENEDKSKNESMGRNTEK